MTNCFSSPQTHIAGITCVVIIRAASEETLNFILDFRFFQQTCGSSPESPLEILKVAMKTDIV